jgi:hypothetical protein
VTAVATVGPAAFHVRLAPPRHGTGTSVTGARVQLRLIDEPGHGGKA